MRLEQRFDRRMGTEEWQIKGERAGSGDPVYSQSQVQQMADKLDELILGLRR